MKDNDLFVTCSQGLEPLLIEELTELGVGRIEPGYRGVYVENLGLDSVYRINYCSRLAGRVLLPLTKFRCFDRDSIYEGISAIDWSLYMKGASSFAIDANVTHRMLKNSLYAAQVAKDAICDQIRSQTGRRPNIDLKNPDVQLNLFIRDQVAVMSFDTSGIPLHKRGYRQEGGEAPLQETLAAAILRLARYKGTEVLFDPCCGTGTFLIEAAMLGSHTPPGFLRRTWGFMHLPDYSVQEWLKVKNEADNQRISLKPGSIAGCDINKNAVWACKVNVRAAGFHQVIDVVQDDFRNYIPKELPNLIVTNPPHGLRLDNVEALKPLYRSLGDFMKRKTNLPAKGFVFTGSQELAKEVGLAANRRHVLNNGGIDSRLLEFDLYGQTGTAGT